MTISSKKINIILLAFTVFIVVGSYIYRQINEKKMSKIGVEIGDLAPEIELPDTSGNPIKLSSFQGNYVLIDFWAAWCRPCRKENPSLMRNVEKYSVKKMKGGTNFIVYSISLDENKAQWLNAIEKDRLKGLIHVSDLKGWNSQSVKTYQIKSIPNNLLIDPEGKVLAIHLKGDNLAKELDKHLE